MQAAQSAGYSANPIAQSLKFGRSPIISMIIGDIRFDFWESLMRSIELEAHDRGFLVSLSNTSGNTENLEASVRHVVAQRVAGIVLSADWYNDALVDMLKSSEIPVVLIDHKVEGFDGDFVALDNKLATGILTRHLIGRGHTRIGLVGGRAGQLSAEERLQGFVDAMAANGLKADDRLIVDGGWYRTSGYEAGMRLLVGSDRPTAVIAANNEMMVGVLQACQELGFACPQDISMCCVDRLPWGDVLRPRITHVTQPVDRMAAQASAWLHERIGSRATTIAAREMRFTPQLVLGESVADIREAA